MERFKRLPIGHVLLKAVTARQQEMVDVEQNMGGGITVAKMDAQTELFRAEFVLSMVQ